MGSIFRFVLLLVFLPLDCLAFAPRAIIKTSSKTTLYMKQEMNNYDRRNVLFKGLATISGVASAMVGSPKSSFGISPFIPDDEVPSSQLPTGDKLDINGAFVTDYMRLPGMYPHAAGKIASNGPYSKISDIYKIEGINENDIKMFKKYESELTVLPPSRTFNERINARVST